MIVSDCDKKIKKLHRGTPSSIAIDALQRVNLPLTLVSPREKVHYLKIKTSAKEANNSRYVREKADK